MFGLIISGRPIHITPTQLSQTQYTFSIPSSPPFSHLGAFLLPGNTLPSDVGATVWIQIPPSTEFKLLGALAQAKQSAIFKLNTSTTSTAGNAAETDDLMLDESIPTSDPGAADITIGISLEPADQVTAQLAQLKATSTTPSTALIRAGATSSLVTTKVLAQRIIGNAFNFLASFGSDTVPLKAFQDWWGKFEKKVELDPTFLEREQG